MSSIKFNFFVILSVAKDLFMQYYIYIATNKRNTVLYTGVTNNVQRRMYEHRNKLVTGFTMKYNVSKLIYYEAYPTAREAMEAEKKIKGWTRQKKLNLILEKNPLLRDLMQEG